MPQDILGVLHASSVLDMHEIFKMCLEQIISHIKQDNVIQLLQVAVDFGNDHIKQACLEHISSCTEAILQRPSILELSREALASIMELPEVWNCSEVDLYRMCRDWARAMGRRQGIILATGQEIKNILGPIFHYIR